nr:MAG TPA: capsid protein [Caudoviricetes sp.]
MANTVYANKVIEAKAKDILTTTINARSMMTIDDSLTASAGMTKTINTYTYTGTAEEVSAGSGNTSRGSISFVGNDYTVKMVQQAFDYTDEDFMKDNVIVDMGIKGATSVMANKMTSDFYSALATKGSGGSTELVKGITFAKGSALSYDVIVDAISELNLEDESKVFVVIPNKWKAALRKDSDYVSARQGEVVYNGQVGTICGIPVIATKALTDKAYVMTNEAVSLFLKKDVEVEQDRDADKRKNSIYLRDCYVCALTDATKACKITEAAS